MNINTFYTFKDPFSFFREGVVLSVTTLQNKILTVASIAFSCLAAYLIYRVCSKTTHTLNQTDIHPLEEEDIETPTSEYLFLAQKEGNGQKGCCGNISVKRADQIREKLQKRAAPGISFDPALYHQCKSLRGTCTAVSLEFVSTYFHIRKDSKSVDPSDDLFLNQMRLVGRSFEKSSKEMRSRQAAYNSITVDPTLNIDPSKNKIESCIRYHDLEIDYVSEERDITTEAHGLQQEIHHLPHGVYFLRMLKPAHNHKLEAHGHSMVYLNEENIKLFYDPNCGLEKMPAMNNPEGGQLYEKLLHIHHLWDTPLVRFYRLKPEDEQNLNET